MPSLRSKYFLKATAHDSKNFHDFNAKKSSNQRAIIKLSFGRSHSVRFVFEN
jgi:hypothetical protein